MSNTNEMNINLLVKTHFEILQQSLTPLFPNEDFYQKSISDIDSFHQKQNVSIIEKIMFEISLLNKALQRDSNQIKLKTLQVIELLISSKLCDDTVLIEIFPQLRLTLLYAVSFSDHYMNGIAYSIIQTIAAIKTKYECLNGKILYEIIDLCIDCQLNYKGSDKEENQKRTNDTLIKLIEMMINKANDEVLNNPNGNNHEKNKEQCIITKSKWLNKIQNEALNKYMEYYLDIVDYSLNNTSVTQLKNHEWNDTNKIIKVFNVNDRKMINEKGIEGGKYGFCINCRNQANFFSFKYSIPICGHECIDEMTMLIEKIDCSLKVYHNQSAHDDLNNLIVLFSHIASIDPKYTWEYNEKSITYLKKQAITLLIKIFSQVFFKTDNQSFINVIKEILFPNVIIHSVLSEDFQLFSLANELVIVLIESPYKIDLKEEIEMYIEKVYLHLLQSESASVEYKTCIIESLNQLCDKSFALELFINYDCNIHSRNLYFELLDVITKLIYGIYDRKSGLNAIEQKSLQETNEMTLRVQCLDLISKLIQHIESLIDKTAIQKPINNTSNVKRGVMTEISLEDNNDTIAPSLNTIILDKSKESKHDQEFIQRILSLKECFKKAIEKFNYSPSNCLNYLLSKEMIASENNFNAYRQKYNSQSNVHNDENDGVDSMFINERNHYLFMDFVINVNNKQKSHQEESILHFLHNYNQNNDIITYEDYSAFIMANFIHNEIAFLSCNQLASFLGSSKPFCIKVLFYFIELFSFKQYHIVEALKSLLSQLPIIKEQQIIQRVIHMFSIKYNHDNPFFIKNPDYRAIIAQSIIDLSDEIIHRQGVNQGTKTLSDYIDTVKSMNKTDCIDIPLLCDVYNKIISSPLIVLSSESKKHMSQLSFNINSSKIVKKIIKELKNKRISQADNNQYKIEKNVDDVVNLIECSWGNFLGIFSQMLNESNNEQVLQKCIDNILGLARISGILRLYTVSDTFIKTIINLTSIFESKELLPKNLQSLRSLVSFILANGMYISSSWYLILGLLSKLDYYHSEQLQSNERKNAAFISKNIPINLIDSIYSCTTLFPSKHLNDFILALCNVSKNELEINHHRAFSLHKIVEVANFNLFRHQNELKNLWKIISDYLTSLISIYMNHEAIICTNAIDSLRQIGTKFLHKKPIVVGSSFQIELFKPFEILFNRTMQKSSLIIGEMILECIASFTNSLKDVIGSGWIVIFDLIKSAVKKKEQSINKLIIIILKPSIEDIANSPFNKEVFVAYVKCLCALYVSNELREYAKENMSNCLQLLISNQKDNKVKEERVRLFLYGFDEFIQLDPLIHLQLLFDFSNNSIESVFTTIDMWEYCYHVYFKIHLVSIILFCYVHRENTIKCTDETFNENDFKLKDLKGEMSINVLLFLDKSLDNNGNLLQVNTPTFIKEIYHNDKELIDNKFTMIQSFDMTKYTLSVEGYIERLLDLIARITNRYSYDLKAYNEDIIISLLQLSRYNQAPEILFKVISKVILGYVNDITDNGWNGIQKNSSYILHSLTTLVNNPIESEIKDIAAYSYYYSVFYVDLLTNYFNLIKSDDNDFIFAFSSLNKTIVALITIEIPNNKHFLMKSQYLIESLIFFVKAKTIILDKSRDISIYYDSSLISTIYHLKEAFINYRLAELKDNKLFKVIHTEIQSIIPRFIKLLPEQDLLNLYDSMINLLITKNKDLRKSAKSMIELLMMNGIIVFNSVRLNNESASVDIIN